MLKTFDRTHWVEDPLLELARERLSRETPITTLRDYYPYGAIVKRDVPCYQLKAGQVLQYARALHEPNQFPIECIIGVQGETHHPEKPRRLRMSSNEVMLCEL